MWVVGRVSRCGAATWCGHELVVAFDPFRDSFLRAFPLISTLKAFFCSSPASLPVPPDDKPRMLKASTNTLQLFR